MPVKSNGEFIPGALPVPSNHPDPFTQNVNAHPIDWAYGVGNTTVDPVAPAAPTGLASAAHTATTVDLTWNASTDNIGVHHYEVYANGVKNRTATGRAATVTGLTTATAYTFTVKAVDTAGNVSTASNSLPVTTA